VGEATRSEENGREVAMCPSSASKTAMLDRPSIVFTAIISIIYQYQYHPVIKCMLLRTQLSMGYSVDGLSFVVLIIEMNSSRSNPYNPYELPGRP